MLLVQLHLHLRGAGQLQVELFLDFLELTVDGSRNRSPSGRRPSWPAFAPWTLRSSRASDTACAALTFRVTSAGHVENCGIGDAARVRLSCLCHAQRTTVGVSLS